MSSVQLILKSSLMLANDHCHLLSLPKRGKHKTAANGTRSLACFNATVQETMKNVEMRLKPKELIEAEEKIFVGTYPRSPIVLSHGKGCELYNVEGKEYLDMTSGIAVNALGHGDPDWIKAVEKQANTLTHVSNVFHSVPQVTHLFSSINLHCVRTFQGGELLHRDFAELCIIGSIKCGVPLVQVELAKRLVESSFADRVFFTNSGAESNETAIKFARKFQRFSHLNTKNPPLGFIAFSNCFHGRTMGALALSNEEHYRLPFEPLMAGVTFVEYGDAQKARELICSGRIAGVFVEPI